MDQAAYYQSLGYQTGAGAVEYYFVCLRTNKTTQQTEICLCGGVSWSTDNHDPAVTMAKIKGHSGYDYSRLGPYPRRADAEKTAIEMSMKIFNVPSKYGIFSESGPRELPAGTSRDPKFF